MINKVWLREGIKMPNMDRQRKIIVVEGKADRQRLKKIIAEEVIFVCTFGTISEYDVEQLMMPYEVDELFVFVDYDHTGERIRRHFHELYPEAIHLYTNPDDIEVEETPYEKLIEELQPYFILNKDF